MSKAAHTSPTAPLRLLDLPSEVAAAIAGHVPEDGVLMLACTSKQCLEAVKTAHAGELRTTIRSMCASLPLLMWARHLPEPLYLNLKLLKTPPRQKVTQTSSPFYTIVGLRVHKKHARVAAKYGSLDVLKWLHQNGCDWSKWTCQWAASGGHLDVLRYAHENGCPGTSVRAQQRRKTGTLTVFDAHENGCDWSKWTCIRAASGGHLDCFKYAHENGCVWDEGTCSEAANRGHLEVMKWLHNNGCPWNEWVCRSAASCGHLDCLQYAHENGCDWYEDTCSAAASGGHLDCLKYAHENGCPWNELTCNNAANEGHLDCLQYAHENGCDWYEDTCTEAAAEGHLDCLQYAHENGCPWVEWADVHTSGGTRTPRLS